MKTEIRILKQKIDIDVLKNLIYYWEEKTNKCMGDYSPSGNIDYDQGVCDCASDLEKAIMNYVFKGEVL